MKKLFLIPFVASLVCCSKVADAPLSRGHSFLLSADDASAKRRAC